MCRTKCFMAIVAGVLLAGGVRGAEAGDDPLPDGAVVRLGSNRLFHTTSLQGVVFSPDGKQLVTAGYGRKLLYWDVGTGRTVRDAPVKEYSITTLERSPDGKSVVLGASTGRVSLHDLAGGEETAFFLDAASRGQVRNVALSPDGKTLGVTQQGALLLWDVASRSLRKKVTGFRSYDMPLAFTPDGKHALTVGPDYKIHHYDSLTGDDVRTLEVPARAPGTPASSGTIRALAVSPDGKVVAGGGNTSAVILWELGTGKVVGRLSTPGHFSPHQIAFRPDGRFLAAASSSRVHVFGVASGKELRQFAVPFAAKSLAWSPDGRQLAGAGGNNMVALWDVGTDRAVHANRGHRYPVMHLCFTPDGKELISGGNDGMLFRWEIPSGRELAQERGSLSNNAALHIADDGHTVRWIGYGETYTWRRGGGVERFPVGETLRRNSNKVLAPDGETVAVATSDRKLQLHSVSDDKDVRELPLPDGAHLSQMEFDGHVTRLAARCTDGRLHVWDVASGEEVRAVGRSGPGMQPVAAFALAANGQAAACWENRLCVYELATGLERLAVPPRPQGIYRLACSADGRLVAGASSDGTFAVHDTLTGKALLERDADQGVIQRLEFSPDGKLLATAGQDTTILVWRVPAPDAVALPEKLDAERAWADLASGDARAAYRTMHVLAGLPDQALPLIRERLKPKEVAIDPARIARLIADLDADDFLAREKATEELAALGKAAEAALREATKHPSLEVRRRAERLLKKITGEGINPELIRTVRAIQVLERLGTPGARELLVGLSKQKLEPAVAREVSASLARLDGRSGS